MQNEGDRGMNNRDTHLINSLKDRVRDRRQGIQHNRDTADHQHQRDLIRIHTGREQQIDDRFRKDTDTNGTRHGNDHRDFDRGVDLANYISPVSLSQRFDDTRDQGRRQRACKRDRDIDDQPVITGKHAGKGIDHIVVHPFCFHNITEQSGIHKAGQVIDRRT